METCLKIDMIICKDCNFRWRTKKEVVLLRFELRKKVSHLGLIFKLKNYKVST